MFAAGYAFTFLNTFHGSNVVVVLSIWNFTIHCNLKSFSVAIDADTNSFSNLRNSLTLFFVCPFQWAYEMKSSLELEFFILARNVIEYGDVRPVSQALCTAELEYELECVEYRFVVVKLNSAVRDSFGIEHLVKLFSYEIRIDSFLRKGTFDGAHDI